MHTREEKLRAFGRLLDVQHRLRKECPWDKKQTMESLRPNTIEEVFELADALMRRDYHEVREADKLMFRHPFIDWNNSQGDWTIDNEPFSVSATDMTINAKGQVVYKDSEAGGSQDADKPKTAAGVEQTWEQIKQRERDGNTSVLSGVPAALPSLIKAYRIQDKARNVGFDWQKKEDVWDKVKEEMGELEAELKKEDKDNSTKELGDFLFSVINAARLYHLNPDNALEHTNRKFISRFGYIEQKAKEQGKSLKDMTLGEMDALWNEAKSVLKDK